MCKPAFKQALFLLVIGGSAAALAADPAPVVKPAQAPEVAPPIATSQHFIYKWTDAQGMMKYSELPPPQGVKFEMVPKSGVGIAGAATPRDLDKDQQELARKLAEQEEQERLQAEAAKQQQDDVRVKNCEAAKKNAQVLESDTGVVLRADDKGNKVPLTPEERALELQRAKKDADYFCNPVAAPPPETAAQQ